MTMLVNMLSNIEDKVYGVLDMVGIHIIVL